MSSCYEFNSYGYGRPSDTPVCYLSTCEQCGNILNYGTCLNCNSGTGNSFTYDPIPESFSEVQISPNPPPQSHFNIYLCQICETNSHYSYECSQRVPPVYEPEPCYIQYFSDNDYSHDLPVQVPSFQTLPSYLQQYPCCEDCGVTHEPYQCQPKNHDYYHEQNSCYDSNSFGFDHGQPPRYTVNHPIFNAHNDLSSQTTLMEQMTQLTSMCEMACQIIQKKQEEKRIEEEQAAKAQNSKILACCDDDDDYNFAITPNEPVDSLSMRDEHLNTIPAMESDEFIKSCVENLVPNPSESEGENGCDVPSCFTTFSNTLFDAEYEFNSKSMLNRDSFVISSSSKIDSLLDEFAGELTLLKSIPPRIDKSDCHPENEIRLTKRLLYDNSSPRPPEEFVYENSNAEIESFSPSPIPVEDSDSRIEEIDLSFNPDDPMPSSIEENDDESERDVLIIEELLDNYSLLLPVIESYHFDIPSFFRPPAKPPDGNTGILNIKIMGDISEQKYSQKLEDSCQRILSSKSLFPQLQLGISLLHLVGSQPMLKSSYKAEDGVIISIPPLVRGVADLVVEIK
nr:hypothetical protein [Tanacetum cinerariifolium]